MTNKNIFLVKNLYNYEQVIPPPLNLPDNFITVYVTDNDTNGNLAKNLGWDYVNITDKFNNVTDLFQKRISIAYINSFPHEFIDTNIDYRLICVCDSNIISLWDTFYNFVEKCDDNHSLFITNGYYSGHRNTLISELNHSNQSRWSYNYQNIKKSYNDYQKELTEVGVDINSLGVCSAKYIIWNPSHKSYKKITEKLYEKYCFNLQGNIILTYMSGLYSDDIFVYHCNVYNNALLNNHNYQS
jgi:hypothetical protein